MSNPVVTSHARTRYLQRGGAVAFDAVDEELRRMFQKGERVARADVTGAARRCGDLLLVYTEGERPTIKTVLRAGGGD